MFLWSTSSKILKATFHFSVCLLNDMKRFWSTTSFDFVITTIFQIKSVANLVNTVILYKPEKVFALVSFISDPRNTNVKNTITCFLVKINFFLLISFFQNGCSVRLLNPQTYSRNVWKLLSVLQEYFNCCVGANV